MAKVPTFRPYKHAKMIEVVANLLPENSKLFKRAGHGKGYVLRQSVVLEGMINAAKAGYMGDRSGEDRRKIITTNLPSWLERRNGVTRRANSFQKFSIDEIHPVLAEQLEDFGTRKFFDKNYRTPLISADALSAIKTLFTHAYKFGEQFR